MRELRPGLWHWQAPHPEWQPGEDWDEVVSSYALDDGERLLLFDPLEVPDEISARADGRETAVVLTCPWHERDTRTLAERFAAPVFVPQADEGSSDMAWLPAEEQRRFAAGERLPVGIRAFPGFVPNDLVLWVESGNAVIAGDSLIDRGEGLEIPVAWLPEGVTRDQVAEGLRPLLELPIEVVLPTHGGPTDRTALELALV